MESYRERDVNDHFINIFFCGTEIWDFIPAERTSLVLTNKGYYETTHQFLKWEYFIFEGLQHGTFSSISSLIQKLSKEKQSKRNCVLVCKADQNLIETTLFLIDSLKLITPKIYQPRILLLSNAKETIDDIRAFIHKKDYDIGEIYKIGYSKNNTQELMASLFKASSYLNQLGDEYCFPISSNSQTNNGNVFSIIEKDYVNRFNIILIGEPGSGKSTFINNMLEEKRSLERQGVPVTNRVLQYKHKSKPIALYDTPGFQSEEEAKSLSQTIKSFVDTFKTNNKDSIHLILYFINGRANFFGNYAIRLLKELNEMKIPLYYLITRSTNESASINEKGVIKVLNSLSFKGANVIAIDQKSYYGLREMYLKLYSHFSLMKYSNKDIREISGNEINTNGYKKIIQSFFFNNQSKNDLITKCSTHAKKAIATFLLMYCMYYGCSYIPILSKFIPELNSQKMILVLAKCYNIELSLEETCDLISSINTQTLLKQFSNSDLSKKLDVNFISEFLQTNNNFGNLDLVWLEKILKIITLMLPKQILKCSIIGIAIDFIINIIKLVIVCVYSINEFETRLKNNSNSNNLIVKALNCYNDSIDFFLELSNNPKWNNK